MKNKNRLLFPSLLSVAFASLVNAVLRNVIRARDELVSPADPFIDTPAWLAARWRKTYGEDLAAAIVRAAALFRDELTLDTLPRGQLATLAKFIGLSPYAPAALLHGFASDAAFADAEARARGQEDDSLATTLNAYVAKLQAGIDDPDGATEFLGCDSSGFPRSRQLT